MAITVNTNMSSIVCRRSLNKATNGMNTALERMSTGLRINSAKDDAAGSAISSKMDYKLSSYGVAQSNAQMGQSMIDTANGALSVMNNMLQRMRDLAEQAANGTYGADERKAMQAEADAIAAELLRNKNTTEFNGIKLLKGKMDEIDSLKFKYGYDSVVVDASNVDSIKAGNVTEGQTYILNIDDGDALQAVLQGNKTGTTVLATDINLTGEWTAVGDTTNYYTGIFDGNGHTISDLTINKPTASHQGLFGAAKKGEIKNVALNNATIIGGNCVGGILGYSNNSSVNNCEVSGSIEGKAKEAGGNTFTGGIVGVCDWQQPIMGDGSSSIINCKSNATVKSAFDNVGGITGYMMLGGMIDNCLSTGAVTGNTMQVGGIAGSVTQGTVIKNCASTGDISGVTSQIGGITGCLFVNSKIEDCYTTSKITSTGVTTGTVLGSTRGTSTAENSYFDTSKNGAMKACGLADGTSEDFPGISGVVNENEIPKDKVGPEGTVGVIKEDYTGVQKPVNVNLQVGVNSDINSVIQVTTGLKIDDFKIDLSSEKKALDSLKKVDKMIAEVTSSTTNLGATSNRLSSTMDYQSVQMASITRANSLIKDADIAKESASYIKNQILQQTTSSLLSTANQNPSVALSLI